ncbi:efflux RND transporter permease subunit [Patescibacteria group bacterium]
MSDELSSYLKKLKFNPKLKDSWAYQLLTNFRVTILIVLTILVAGVFSFLNLPKRINPDVNIPIVFVSTVFPGAGPEDVEELISKPLEDAIESVDKIEQISSTSQDNISSIVVELSSRVKIDEATRDIQAAVDSVTGLPSDSLDPKVMALNFEDVPVISFVLTSNTETASLMRFARQLKNTLEDLPEVQKVTVSGLEKTELEILINPEVYNLYKISPFTLQQAIKTALQAYPSGTISSNGSNMAISVEMPNKEAEKLRNLPLKLNQSQVVLGEIAAISLKSSPEQANSFYADNATDIKRTVSVSVFKTVSADLEQSAGIAKKTAKEEIAKTDDRFQMLVITDFDKQISDQFKDLVLDFSASIILVFITLLIFLGIRQAAIASFVIPLSFLATFATMYVVDLQLSFLSIFSLLLGLGMIVDDAIVMISAMSDYYKSGKFTPNQTGIQVWNDFLAPTLSSNLTNIWSFLPLLIATGIIGEFTKVISYVVTIALIASTIIALIITIPFMIVVLKPQLPKRVVTFSAVIIFIVSLISISVLFGQNPLLVLIIITYICLLLLIFLTKDLLYIQSKSIYRKYLGKYLSGPALKQKLKTGFISAKKPINLYKRYLLRILKSPSAKRKTMLAVIGLSIFSYLLVPLGLVQNEFFPKTDEDTVYVSLELPIGTRIEKTQEEALLILNDLRKISDVSYVLADVGSEVNLRSTSQLDNTNQVRFSLKLEDKRKLTSIEISQNIREKYQDFTRGEIQVVEVSGGPPTGADLEITLLGNDVPRLQNLAAQVQDYLKQKKEVTNVNLSIKPGLSKLVFIPDNRKLINNNITMDQIAFTIRLFTSGSEIDTFTFEEGGCKTDCPIQLRLLQNSLDARQISKISILNQDGQLIPLLTLGEIKLKESPTKITRLNGKRSITISASVLPEFNRVMVGKDLENFVATNLNLPLGYSWQTGGANDENEKSVNSILQAMVIAAILIMGTMVVELKSFRQAFIVMLVIPLAVSGVFIVFALTGTPLSFPALIGILALFGIVVKNSIMMVDKINLNLKIGLPFTEAVADGSSSRLEPILFSSVTNIIGLTPITLSDPLWRGLGGAIISGLTLSGIIMLFFIPLVYDAWYRKEQ